MNVILELKTVLANLTSMYSENIGKLNTSLDKINSILKPYRLNGILDPITQGIQMELTGITKKESEESFEKKLKQAVVEMPKLIKSVEILLREKTIDKRILIMVLNEFTTLKSFYFLGEHH